MKKIMTVFSTLFANWKCSIILAAAFAFACWQSVLQIRSEWVGSAALLALLACLLYEAVKLAPSAAGKSGIPWGRFTAWPPIILALALLFLPWSNPHAPILKFGAWFFFALGAVSFFCGVKAMLAALIPLLVCFLAVPFREQIVLYLSYPLRMVSTVLSVGFLRIFGMGIENNMTTIRIEGLDIAITDACSGIQQFEAMILVAYWLVLVWQRSLFWRCIHYAFLLPSIILANAIRIISTILLYKMFGDVILGNAWHSSLGYVQVILAVAIFFLVGCILPEKHSSPSAAKSSAPASKGESSRKKKKGAK